LTFIPRFKLQQSGADGVPDERHQDQAVDAPTVSEPVAASDRLALQTVQRAARSVQPDDAGQRHLLLRGRPVHRRVYIIRKYSSKYHFTFIRKQLAVNPPLHAVFPKLKKYFMMSLIDI